MTRRMLKTFALGTLLMLTMTPLAWAPCEEDPTIMCGIQCGTSGTGGGLYCADPSNPERACWDSGTGGSCGEDANYPSCAGDCFGAPSDGGF